MRFLQLSILSFLFACGEEIPSSFKEGDSDYDGVTEEEGDCDDSTAAISPNMFDFVGDGIDNNCDGIDGEDSDGDGFASEASGGTDCDDTNAEITEGFEAYADNDLDGFGDERKVEFVCELGTGFSETIGDCDDNNENIHPEALEICDSIDNDCDTLTDDEDDSIDSSSQSTYFADTDLDGFGDAEVPSTMCTANEGFVANSDDCDDTNAVIFLNAEEACDGVDNNCDGVIDEGVKSIFYIDSDGDGFALDSTTPEEYCEIPEGYTTELGDCDDADATKSPLDADGDGFSGCSELIDCDDTKAFFNPNMTDIAGDGFDQNCDGVDGQDSDGDGYASTSSGGTDCDDSNSDISPLDTDGDGVSGCDGDCNDLDPAMNPLDADGDGFSTCDENPDCDDSDAGLNPNSGSADNLSCAIDLDGDGFASVENGGTDCDDTDASLNPSAEEVCDGIDNNCDDGIDEGLKSVFYIDGDGDGFALDSTTPEEYCEIPEGYTTELGDCDDADATKSPLDADGDGFSGCSELIDCDDTKAFFNPNMTDIAGDGFDQNCDGVDGQDIDGDGEASLASGGLDCEDNDGAITSATDNDGDGKTYCGETATNILPRKQ